MILVAATAIGCGLVQWIGLDAGGSYRAIGLLINISWLAMPLVASWTLAMIPIRLRGPRPRLRRLARQPGMMASCAAGVAIAFITLIVVAVRLVLYVRGNDEQLDLGLMEMLLLVFVPMSIGSAVTVAWVGLLFGRRWRAEPGWVDRLGRALGIFWIATGLLVPCGVIFQNSRGSACAVRSYDRTSGPTQEASPTPDPSTSDAEAR
jgi:hypothetical protein